MHSVTVPDFLCPYSSQWLCSSQVLYRRWCLAR